MATTDKIQKPGKTRFGLRVAHNDDGTFTFTVLVSENGKQLGNAQLSAKDSKAVGEYIVHHV